MKPNTQDNQFNKNINHHQLVRQHVIQALMEDGAWNDLSSFLLQGKGEQTAHLVNKESCVLVGVDWFESAFKQLSNRVTFKWHCKEGDVLKKNEKIVQITGSKDTLLQAERVAINFVQILSATATLAKKYVDQVDQAGINIKILDTRKTIPNLRYAQKYATQVVGVVNHRFGLNDQLMIKDNHIAAYGDMVSLCKAAFSKHCASDIIVEVDGIDQIKQLISHRLLPGRLLLDNFTPTHVQQAVALCNGACGIEVSGGITLDNLRQFFIKGVDCISIGAITKIANSIDFSLEF